MHSAAYRAGVPLDHCFSWNAALLSFPPLFLLFPTQYFGQMHSVSSDSSGSSYHNTAPFTLTLFLSLSLVN